VAGFAGGGTSTLFVVESTAAIDPSPELDFTKF
jgi:hypothetical protein